MNKDSEGQQCQSRDQQELDVYHGARQPLMTLETEFATEEQALAWSPPWFASSEVTGDTRYKNAQMAMTGTPDHG